MLKLFFFYFSLTPLMGHSMLSKIESAANLCDLRLPTNIIYQEGAENHLHEGIKSKSNCTGKKITKIINALISINGEIPSTYLRKIFKNLV